MKRKCLPAGPASTACGATAAGGGEQEKGENTRPTETKNKGHTTDTETKQPNNKKWDEEEEGGGRRMQQAGNKVKRRSKSMSNMEIVKINHYTIKG